MSNTETNRPAPFTASMEAYQLIADARELGAQVETMSSGVVRVVAGAIELRISVGVGRPGYYTGRGRSCYSLTARQAARLVDQGLRQAVRP